MPPRTIGLILSCSASMWLSITACSIAGAPDEVISLARCITVWCSASMTAFATSSLVRK